MASKKKPSKRNSLQKWCLILGTVATLITAIATLTAVVIQFLEFLL